MGIFVYIGKAGGGGIFTTVIWDEEKGVNQEENGRKLKGKLVKTGQSI